MVAVTLNMLNIYFKFGVCIASCTSDFILVLFRSLRLTMFDQTSSLRFLRLVVSSVPCVFDNVASYSLSRKRGLHTLETRLLLPGLRGGLIHSRWGIVCQSRATHVKLDLQRDRWNGWKRDCGLDWDNFGPLKWPCTCTIL